MKNTEVNCEKDWHYLKKLKKVGIAKMVKKWYYNHADFRVVL